MKLAYGPTLPNQERDRGSIMPMATILVAFLMIGSWSLISASQQWAARRDVQGVAASAARAGAQGDQQALRRGGVLDPDAAADRAQAIIAASGYAGVVSVDGDSVTVSVTAGIDYAFPAPGFPGSVDATASAVAVSGVTGEEGG
jgi:Flp pilus assembly protein TadG